MGIPADYDARKCHTFYTSQVTRVADADKINVRTKFQYVQGHCFSYTGYMASNEMKKCTDLGLVQDLQ